MDKNETSQEERNHLKDSVEELERLREEIEDKLYDMKKAIKRCEPMIGSLVSSRANQYWMAHIKGALRKQEYGGGSFINMDDTLQEINDEI